MRPPGEEPIELLPGEAEDPLEDEASGSHYRQPAAKRRRTGCSWCGGSHAVNMCLQLSRYQISKGNPPLESVSGNKCKYCYKPNHRLEECFILKKMAPVNQGQNQWANTHTKKSKGHQTKGSDDIETKMRQLEARVVALEKGNREIFTRVVKAATALLENTSGN